MNGPTSRRDSDSKLNEHRPQWFKKSTVGFERTIVVGVEVEARPLLDGSRSASRIATQHRDNAARYGLEGPFDSASDKAGYV
jgi:hypothetical protein